MELNIKKLTYQQCADYILPYLIGGSWDEQIRQNLLPNLSQNPSKAEIASLLKQRSELRSKEYDKNINAFLSWWRENGESDFKELLKIMEIKIPQDKKSITWLVGDTYICPRDIEKWSFVMSPDLWKWSAINTALHEITHFVWFEKVKQIENIKHFSQNPDDESYLPYWYLSEIVIDPILNSASFAKKYEMTWKSYSEFYNIKIENQNLLDYIKELWEKRTGFDDFYSKSSSFVYNNWREIEKQYLDFYNTQNTVKGELNSIQKK